MLENLFLFTIIALLVESVWESLKLVWQEGKINVDRIGVIVIAVFICIGAEVDLFKALDITLPRYAGEVFTGIICSRGANFIHEVIQGVGK